MGAKTITITVPEELHGRMQRWREYFNYSNLAATAISNEIRNIERLFERINDKRTLEEISKSSNWKAKLSSPDSVSEFKELGETLGIFFAKYAPYHVVKDLEEEIGKAETCDREKINEIIEKKLVIEDILKGALYEWEMHKMWRVTESIIADTFSKDLKLTTFKRVPMHAEKTNLLSIKEGFKKSIVDYATYIWRKKP